MSEPTARPWSSEDTTLAICRLIISVDEVPCVEIHPAANSNHAIAYIPTDYKTSEQRTNAEFIVRAVNCHDELLAALKAVLLCETRHDERGHAYIAVPARSLHDLGAQLAALIAKAEGTTHAPATAEG